MTRQRCGRAPPGDGPGGGASGRPGTRAGRSAALFAGRRAGLYAGAGEPLGPLGASAAPAGPRPGAQAPLDAAARVALGTGHQDHAPTAAGPWASPRRVWRPRGSPAGAGDLRLAEQHGVWGAHQPDHPAAWRGGGAACQDAVQGRGWRAAAVEAVSDLRELLLVPCQLTPALAATPPDPQDGLSHMLVALDTSHGGGVDRPGVDLERSPAISGATVAAATGAVSSGGSG